jgi:hypothetical protein
VAPTSGLAGDVKPKDLALAINRAAASGGRSYRSAGNSAKVKVSRARVFKMIDLMQFWLAQKNTEFVFFCARIWWITRE